MSRIIRGAAVLAAAVLALAACGGGDDDPLGKGGAGGGGSLVIGGADFPESGLIGEIYAQALEAKGVKVQRKFGIGSREVYMKQVRSGAIQVFPEYNGALLSFLDKNDAATTSDAVDSALKQKLPSDLTILNPAQAEDKDTLAVTSATAAKYKLKTIEDLKPVAGQFVLGGPPEFKTRKQGVVGLQSVYGLTFKDFKSLSAGSPITVSNLKDGKVQIANLFSTDPAIKKNGFLSLADPKNVFGAQNVVPLVNKTKVDTNAQAALNAVSAKLTTDGLLAMNTEMADKKADPATVAKKWLTDNGLA
ncbi:putative osmoprotectant uptake system substrate-binding protein OsmF precursor [Actinomadura rubteroloni]|uniref:Putative osmoprotectant uptake system substrate-binding protein OsmF n=1 Tax=Actinomadura rubteroloni TaxID=1926885 RepID=A0A2P4UHZ6_9ACTN|nr:ABC transporter substrate-binding protein [Actinomadura rubteroloni]POM24677.1 putative osmoprotectant uptake system substrate-binding protein OsmF precursor [Actinomadura rubteroloni]